MKLNNLAIAIIILLTGGFFFFLSGNDTQRANTARTDPAKIEYHTNETTYDTLRNAALSVTPEQLGITLSGNDTQLYGIIMEWEMEGVIITLPSYSSGDASLYLSSGGGIIGGGPNENVNKAARNFVSAAAGYLPHAANTSETTKASVGQLKFFFLTNKGTFVSLEQMKKIEDGSSLLAKLFNSGNDVVTQLRIVSEGK